MNTPENDMGCTPPNEASERAGGVRLHSSQQEAKSVGGNASGKAHKGRAIQLHSFGPRAKPMASGNPKIKAQAALPNPNVSVETSSERPRGFKGSARSIKRGSWKICPRTGAKRVRIGAHKNNRTPRQSQNEARGRKKGTT